MVEILEKLWTILWLWSPLLLVIVILLSRTSIKSWEKEKSNFWSSLILAFFVGLIGMLEVRPGGWNIQLLFRPFFVTKWMFIAFSIIWPILVFINLSKQVVTVGIAKLIICFGIVGLLISAIGRPYVEYKDQEDRQFWDSFFENNEINKPISELKKRLTKEGRHTLSQHLRTGYTTTVESLAIITEMCREILDDLEKNKRSDEGSYGLKITCQQGISGTAQNRNIDREFIEKYLAKKDKNGLLVYETGLALNDSTPVDILVRLIQSPEPPIYNLVMNANTPREVFEIIACDDNDYESVLLRMKKLEKKNGLAVENVDYLRNIRLHLNMMYKSEKERIQSYAKGTLKRLQGRDRAAEIINQAIQAVKRNEVWSVGGILSEIKERDLSMRDREQVYYGMLLCITGDYAEARRAYVEAERQVSSHGQYNINHIPQYITTLLLIKQWPNPDAVLSKMNKWYPDNTKLREFNEIYLSLKQELEKFAVSENNHPDKAPESMDTFLSFKIFD
ncbi:MAG: hypothetical protein FIA99_08275 [Ruminiclostridium sp.]|nr:hypothetical protein [Ruminiclostridium sp.]